VQLDFDLHGGPLKPTEPKILTVSELTRRVRGLLESGIGETWVEGEISNLRRQASGHQYFTLKDALSQLSCVLFKRSATSLRDVCLADGQSVQIFGEISVYEARGQYQMIVRTVQNRGEGALQARFEALKRQLAAEGLFAEERKRALPRFPRRVGLVTSPSGAAVRDFLNVLHRRDPGIAVLISPVRVQGRGASAEIVRAIEELGHPEIHGLPPVDVIVLTRGGGSIEDLWEFNEEQVARAIAASPVPVVSAIGHEIDFTIADFAADLRAPTPSAAAELLASDRMEALARLRQSAQRITRACRSRLELARVRLRALQQSSALREPARRLQELRQSLDRAAGALSQGPSRALESRGQRLARSQSRLDAQSPGQAIRETRLRCQMFQQRLGEPIQRHRIALQAKLDRCSGILASLSPEATLVRGFTITTDAKGNPLTSVKKICKGMTLRTRFADGETESEVGSRKSDVRSAQKTTP